MEEELLVNTESPDSGVGSIEDNAKAAIVAGRIALARLTTAAYLIAKQAVRPKK